VRTAKSGELVQANDLATVTVFPSVGFPSMIGASVATYARVSSGSVQFPHCRRRGSPARRNDRGAHGCRPYQPRCCRGGSYRSTPRWQRDRNSLHVPGIICISHMAPFFDRARCSPPLSTRITARIQCSGTLKRLDASMTNVAKGWTVKSFGRLVVDEPCPACAAPPTASMLPRSQRCTSPSREVASLPSCSPPSMVKRCRPAW
jgi:hypothetical protein